ncbi:MAG: OmpA family protein [Pararhodobacter sp.]
MKHISLSFTLVVLLMTAPAFAQTYSRDQIIDFLAGTAELGASRSLCIGTVAECAPPAAPGLDMRVQFDLDSDRLTPEASQVLGLFAGALVDPRLAAADFRIEGHTDARGGAAYNDQLSERRAQAVRSFLIDVGVPETRLEAVGLGQSAPRTADPLDDENRRVELRAVIR